MFLHSICWWLLEPFDINDKFSVQILIKPFHLLALKKFCWDYLITNIGRKSLTSTTTNLQNKHFLRFKCSSSFEKHLFFNDDAHSPPAEEQIAKAIIGIIVIGGAFTSQHLGLHLANTCIYFDFVSKSLIKE